MAAVGVQLGNDVLYLTKGRDLRWEFRFVDKDRVPTDFPDGELYLEVFTDPLKVWKTNISGDVATLKVEHEVTDQVPNRTRWQLVFKPAGEAAGGDPVARGFVKVQA